MESLKQKFKDERRPLTSDATIKMVKDKYSRKRSASVAVMPESITKRKNSLVRFSLISLVTIAITSLFDVL